MGKKQLDLFSPLYCRLNGTMLGFFLFASKHTSMADYFSHYRLRMQQFLDEIKSGIKLPKSQPNFLKKFGTIHSSILDLFMKKYEEGVVDLLGSFLLGYEFLHKAMGVDGPDPALREVGFKKIMDDYGLDHSTVEQYAAQITLESGQIHPDDLMTPALDLLRETILPLDVEPDTCFVAMPFAEPFESYYSTVYRPLLAKHGLRAIRAWGGVANEVHTNLMFTLIDASEWFLAELTGKNVNVILELGFAWGRDKKVVSIIDVSKSKHFANLRGHMSIAYDSSAEGWMDEVLNGDGNKRMQAFVMVYSGWKPGQEIPT